MARAARPPGVLRRSASAELRTEHGALRHSMSPGPRAWCCGARAARKASWGGFFLGLLLLSFSSCAFAHPQDDDPGFHAPSERLPAADADEQAAPVESEPGSTPSAESPVEPSTTYQSTTFGERNRDPAERWTIEPDPASAEARSTADQLRRVPGVVVQRHATEGKGEQFLVRGFDAGHGTDVELTLNGVPLNAASHIHGHGYLDLSWIPTAALFAIDWKPGSFALEQGAFATAGTIALTVGGAHHPEIGYRTSSTLRQQVWARYVDDEQPHDRWIATEFVRDWGYGEGRGVTRGNFLVSTRVIDRRRLTLNAQLGASANRYEVPSFVKRDDMLAGRIGYYDAYEQPNDGEAQTAWLALPFTIRTAKRWRLDGFANLDFRRFRLLSTTTGYLVDVEHGDTKDIEDQRLSLRGRVAARRNVHRDLQLRTFSEVATTLLRQSERHVTTDRRVLDTPRALDAAASSATAGVGLRWYPHLDWTVDASLRVDYLRFDVQDFVADADYHDDGWIVSPRGSVHWRPLEGFELRAAYGRGFRPWEAQAVVPAADREVPTDDLARPPPRPTITDHAELALGFRSESVALRVAAFAIFSADEYYFDHVARASRSLGATRRLGGELALSADLLRWWRVEVAGLAVDARLLDRSADSRVPAVPVVHGRVETEFGPFAGVTVSGSLRFVGRRTLLYETVAAGYAIADAELAWTRGGLRLWLGVENLANTEYSEAEYAFASAFFPDESRSQIPRLHVAAGPPRLVHAGVTYQF